MVALTALKVGVERDLTNKEGTTPMAKTTGIKGKSALSKK
jgi:hypothetical protein